MASLEGNDGHGCHGCREFQSLYLYQDTYEDVSKTSDTFTENLGHRPGNHLGESKTQLP